MGHCSMHSAGGDLSLVTHVLNPRGSGSHDIEGTLVEVFVCDGLKPFFLLDSYSSSVT